MLDVVPFQGGFVAVGASRGVDGWVHGITWKSLDGVHWAQVSNDASLDAGLSRVLVSGGRLIAAGSITVDPINGGLQRPAIRVSANGGSWTQTFARDCCGEMVDIVDSGQDLLAVYRWYVPDGPGGVALLRSIDGEHWLEIGAPRLDAGVSWIRLLHVGGSLGLVGLGMRDLGDAAYQPLLLIPPPALTSH